MTKKVYLQPYHCLGCEECVEACAKEHEWDSHSHVLWVDMVYPVSMRCFHCEDPPCIKVCPVDAIKVSAEYGIQVDGSVCIGCGSCVLACPFGVPIVNSSSGKMVKCDLCIDRQKEGKQPACVENCPYGALILTDFVDVRDDKRDGTAKKMIEAGTYLRAAINTIKEGY
ncbi:MAG TPA: 4Fe-4S dicluster domain-containing protein [Candidatus Methanomethylophilaceae archaeon]|nr:4Fe-4S dicluster domain-containing protein [Candidatus Methanomethylophilaceae archaeon]